MPALVSERTVLDALAAGRADLAVPAGALVTALARDTARDHGLTLRLAEPADGRRRGAALPAPTPPRPVAGAPAQTLALGCDHAGFEIKDALAAHARALGWTITDVGTGSAESVDYPDFAYAVGRLVHLGQTQLGLMIDGVGVGSAIVANKLPGVRAALCPDVFSAFNARAHNDANVLTLGSRTMGVETCKRVLAEFLGTDFEGGRHARRVQKIADVEARFLPGAPGAA
ncbi:ribose 5-phosphate isomerase B [Rubrivirga litoralis]|uniref:Ribose 5-phosphate isomerase B n=1 Tax=Rubrivirga litoralis TaxID=3075598 RepID=A0ABU3BMV2_9BACT|nr:ribose 5-phosphate isomerase B [Rubrivirga sp. F394]MDT0630632.1 ribose 5-phosphate isomerase B [Rubrivirga sp. F394]